MGLSLSPPIRSKVATSDHLPEDLLHFLGRECSKCFGSEVATGAEAQRKRSRALVIGCPANRNDVVFAERPIKVLDGDAGLLGHLFEGLRSPAADDETVEPVGQLAYMHEDVVSGTAVGTDKAEASPSTQPFTTPIAIVSNLCSF